MATPNECINILTPLAESGLDAAHVQRAQQIADGAYNYASRQNVAESDVSLLAKTNALQLLDTYQQRADYRSRLSRLEVVREENFNKRIARAVESGVAPYDAIKAALAGSHKKFFGSRDNIDGLRRGIYNKYMGHFINYLDDPEIISVLRDNVLNRDFMRGMLDPDFRSEIAKVNNVIRQTRSLLDVFHSEANNAGFNMGYESNYFPQLHDSMKLASAGKDAWVDSLINRVDVDRMLWPGATEDAIRVQLSDMFDNIVQGKLPSEFSNAGLIGFDRGLNAERHIHFKSPEDAMWYHGEYGSGNFLDIMRGYFNKGAREIAIMNTLGPDPRRVIENTIRTYSANDANLVKKWNFGNSARNSFLNNLLYDLEGRSNGVMNPNLAKWFSTVRNINTSAKMGTATISSLVDLNNKAIVFSDHFGQNLLEGYANALTSIRSAVGDPEYRNFLRINGAYIDGFLDSVNRFDTGEGGFSGVSGMMARMTLRLSFLQQWTEWNKAGTVAVISNTIGEANTLRFDQLNDRFRLTMERHGIESNQWELIRQMHTIDPHGKEMFVPELIHQLPDEAIQPFLRRTPENLTNEAVRAADIQFFRNDFHNRMMGMLADETAYAVLEADAITRAATNLGQPRGTWLGEGIRSIGQFKSFPIGFVTRILLETNWRDPGAVGRLLVGSTVLGYLSMTIKDLLNGRSPRDPRKIETWTSAMMQGGAAGMYGDILFGQYNPAGNELVSSLAGPTLDTANDVLNIWKQLIRGEVSDAGVDAIEIMINNVPGSNLWYAKLGLDSGFLNAVRELLHEGSTEARQQFWQNRYGSTFLYDPAVSAFPALSRAAFGQ